MQKSCPVHSPATEIFKLHSVFAELKKANLNIIESVPIINQITSPDLLEKEILDFKHDCEQEQKNSLHAILLFNKLKITMLAAVDSFDSFLGG